MKSAVKTVLIWFVFALLIKWFIVFWGFLAFFALIFLIVVFYVVTMYKRYRDVRKTLRLIQKSTEELEESMNELSSLQSKSWREVTGIGLDLYGNDRALVVYEDAFFGHDCVTIHANDLFRLPLHMPMLLYVKLPDLRYVVEENELGELGIVSASGSRRCLFAYKVLSFKHMHKNPSSDDSKGFSFEVILSVFLVACISFFDFF